MDSCFMTYTPLISGKHSHLDMGFNLSGDNIEDQYNPMLHLIKRNSVSRSASLNWPGHNLSYRPIGLQSNGWSATIITLHTRFRASSQQTNSYNNWAAHILVFSVSVIERALFQNSLTIHVKTKQVFTSPLPSPPCLFGKFTREKKVAEAFRKCQLLPLGLHHMLCPSHKHV